MNESGNADRIKLVNSPDGALELTEADLLGRREN